jgi:CBS domain-containing protein
LSDVIGRLRLSAQKSVSVAEKLLGTALDQPSTDHHQAAELKAFLTNTLAKAFETKVSPNLRSLLTGNPKTVVKPSSSVLEAAVLMSENRKAALVVGDDGALVGIFGFKDMMSRVIAKELPMNTTMISQVMTPHPESLSPEATVLDALQLMNDNHFLSLPVCENDEQVIGVVDVMDVIYGCGGADGWRSIINDTLDGDDDDSDTVTVRSREASTAQGSANSAPATSTVAALRPSKPHVSSSTDSILTVAQLLASKRGAAALVVDSLGHLAGIFTDTDLTRRVVAKYVSLGTTSMPYRMTCWHVNSHLA